eukprot:SAG11_NODE_58_length_19205_cov_30.697315_17_plen_210_part_00
MVLNTKFSSTRVLPCAPGLIGTTRPLSAVPDLNYEDEIVLKSCSALQIGIFLSSTKTLLPPVPDTSSGTGDINCKFFLYRGAGTGPVQKYRPRRYIDLVHDDVWRQLRLETRCLGACEGTVSAGVGLLPVCACRKLWECGTSGFGGRRSARQARWGAGAPRARRDFSWQVERAQDALKMLYDRMTVSAPRALCAAGVFVACGLGAVVEL